MVSASAGKRFRCNCFWHGRNAATFRLPQNRPWHIGSPSHSANGSPCGVDSRRRRKTYRTICRRIPPVCFGRSVWWCCCRKCTPSCHAVSGAHRLSLEPLSAFGATSCEPKSALAFSTAGTESMAGPKRLKSHNPRQALKASKVLYSTSRKKRTDDRPNAGQRGYGATWQKCRAMHIAREPLCRECGKEGRLVSATEVDHIKPLAAGGDRYDPANLQSLCRSHHARKTWREKAGPGGLPRSDRSE